MSASVLPSRTFKRRRTLSLQEDNSRLPDESRTDGSIVIQAELTQFRVYMTMLTRHSSVFGDMFSVTSSGIGPDRLIVLRQTTTSESYCTRCTIAVQLHPSSMHRYQNGTSTRAWSSRKGGVMVREDVSNDIVDQAHGFPYSRKLEAHRSCVNALAFSSGEGRFLASGGDDLRILLWDFYQDDIKQPSYTLRGPKGNVFTLQFSTNNKYLFSGGASEMVLKYDIEHFGSPVEVSKRYSPDQVFRDHTDSIRALTCHPNQDEIFMSASEDGTIRRHDVRQPHKSTATQDVIATTKEVTGVQWHPRMEHLFSTSDGAGRVFLRDARMAFGSSNGKTASTGEGIILRYNTKITKKGVANLSNPESSSVVFDRDGTKLAVTFLHYLPTIYALSDPDPVAVLSGKNLPDGTPNPPGQRSYSNSCTIKNGAFGGPGLDTDNMYAAGSDDFRGYVWRIPPLDQLKEQQQTLSMDEWLNFDTTRIAFSERWSSSKILPVEIETPLCRLTGHNSIVNTTAFHPHFLHIATSGVEKTVVLHSPTPSSPCTQNLSPSPVDVRQLNNDNHIVDSMAHLGALLGYQNVNGMVDSNERQTLSIFDHILREEGEADVFAQRPVRSSDSSSDEEGDEMATDSSDEAEDTD